VKESPEERIRDNFTFYAHGNRVKYASYSLGLLSNKNWLRKILVRLVTWRYFEWFITAMILTNSFLLGMMDYTDKENTSWQNKLVEATESFFIYIFLLEAIFKICAMGFIIGNGSYLKNAWNWLAFIVVITSLLTFLPSMRNISGLRTFRLFRPLRNLNNFPSMSSLVGTLLQSMSQLGGILSLAIFFFLIFAILGVNLWSGTIHYRCWSTNEQGVVDFTTSTPADKIGLCTVGGSQCHSGYKCASLLKHLIETNAPSLAEGYQYSEVRELNWGITNFDNIGSAFLTIFQCITMEGWTEIMYIYMDAYSTVIVVFYYICCVIVCSLFLLNMTIAVMLKQYEELERSTSAAHIEVLRDHAIGAKLPPRLVDLIIKHDMQLKKNKVEDEEERKGFCTKMRELFNAKVVVPDGPYYEASLV
jgi:hypothetical protein